MAALPRCLCFVLTVWMAGTHPSGSIRFGSSLSARWWEAKDAARTLEAARRYRARGDFAAAEQVYQRAYEQAARQRNYAAAISYLSGAASCRLALFHYRGALETYLNAKRLAASVNDRLDQAAVAINLSSLYQDIGDRDAALREAQEALTMVNSLPQNNYKAQISILLGRLLAGRDDDYAEALFREAIEVARTLEHGVSIEAVAWDLLGEERLSRGRLEPAERALEEAFRLRSLLDRGELGFSYGALGALKLAQGDWRSAADFTARAITEGTRRGTTRPDYRLLHQRGRIRLACSDVPGALQDFREALAESARWRMEVLPAASSLDGANQFLEQDIFDSFIEAGAAEALRAHSSRLAQETFQAVELNRSAVCGKRWLWVDSGAPGSGPSTGTCWEHCAPRRAAGPVWDKVLRRPISSGSN